MSSTYPDPAAPQPKETIPPLAARAPRPPVMRLRRGVVVGAAMAAAGLLAGSFAWAFVVQPELRDAAHGQKLKDRETDAQGAVRPSGVITDQPATYGQLPEPRRLGARQEPEIEPVPAAAPPPPATARASPNPGRSITVEARESGLFFGGAANGEAAAGGGQRVAGPSRDYAAVYNTHELLAPLSPYELKAGAVIPAVMLTGVDTGREGPVVATVTDNIYDTVSGRHLIIPQGARLIGRHEGESRYGDKRAFLAWDRLILPNGKSLVLTQEPGVDAEGAVGVKGRVNRRIGALVVATVFAGAITTLGQAARDRDNRSAGWFGNAGDAAAIEAAQVGGKLIDRELTVRPSIQLRPGARVRVLITRDLVLEPYRT